MLQVHLGRVGWLLFAARFLRLFGYGVVAVVLLLYLSEIGLSPTDVGILLFLTLFGDAFITVFLTSKADRTIGRKRTLVMGAILMAVSGIVFSLSTRLWILLLAATFGVISPAGSEIGPFLAVEQAALTQIVSNEERTAVFSWQNLVGVAGQAMGAVIGAVMVQSLTDDHGVSKADAYRSCFWMYSCIGSALVLLYRFVPEGLVEAAAPSVRGADGISSRAADSAQGSGSNDSHSTSSSWFSTTRIYEMLGVPKSGGLVAKISVLFALDAFAGAMVLQSIIVYWFHVRFEMNTRTLGTIVFFVNIIAAISSLVAVPLSKRFGLVNTMVFTHLPSHVLLLLVPLMPNAWSAIAVLLLRFTISQMDVPTRQSYVAAVVDPHERSAAAGVNTLARSLGSSVGPLVSGFLMEHPDSIWFDTPFFFAAGLKTIYDILLWREFVSVHAVEERTSAKGPGYSSLPPTDHDDVEMQELVPRNDPAE